MAKEQATFAINLEDGVSGSADDARKALEALRDSVQRDTKALQSLQQAMKRLQAGSTVNVQQFRALQAQMQATKDRIAQAQGAILDLGGSLEGTRRPASGFRAALEQLQKQAQGVGGPVGGLTSKMGSLKALLAGGAMTLGVVALAVALIALSVAAVSATASLVSYGLAQSDARRSELLHLEGITKLRNMWGIAAGSAKDLQAAIDNVSGSTAIGRGAVAGYAEQLYRAGVRGQNLSDALEAVSIKASTQGDAAAKAFAGWATGVALTGGSVKALADNVKRRLGGIAAKQMLSLGVQAEKLRENMGRIFGDLKIEGVLHGLQRIGDLFNINKESGKALQQLLELVFTPLAKAFEFIAPLARHFFQGMILAAQDLAIFFLDVALSAKHAFGDMLPKNLDLGMAALKAGKFALLAFAGAMIPVVALGGLVVLVLGTMAAVATLAGVVWAALGYAVIKAVGFVASGVSSLYKLLTGMGARLGDALSELSHGLGRSIIDGIVAGIKSGAKWVMEALTGLAGGAMGAFRDALGIHSPSREFAKLGAQLPAGIEQGIEQGSDSVDRSVGGLAAPPSAPGAGASGKSIMITIGDITIQTSASSAPAIAQDLRAALEDILSGLAAQMGAT